MNDKKVSGQKPPTVLDGLIQPWFPAKIFTVLFYSDCMVFCKTGSFSPYSEGTMRTALGGYTGKGLIMGAIGSILDFHIGNRRINKAAGLSAFVPEDIVNAHKRNFLIHYTDITEVICKGPNFANELRLRFFTGKETHKFRLDNQNKTTAKYIREILNEFLPGKVVVK